jgi:hypothetical protein
MDGGGVQWLTRVVARDAAAPWLPRRTRARVRGGRQGDLGCRRPRVRLAAGAGLLLSAHLHWTCSKMHTIINVIERIQMSISA